MTQQEAFIRQQQELDEALLQMLISIKRTGSIRNKVLDTLMSRGLIHYHGPDESHRYSHHRLTPSGEQLIKKLQQTQDMTRHTRG